MILLKSCVRKGGSVRLLCINLVPRAFPFFVGRGFASSLENRAIDMKSDGVYCLIPFVHVTCFFLQRTEINRLVISNLKHVDIAEVHVYYLSLHILIPCVRASDHHC